MACGEKKPDPDVLRKEKSLERFATLQNQLTGALQAAIKEEGFAAAIGKCQTLSPELAARQSDGDVRIRRISDRFRNPAHAPDAWEASVLAQWTEDMAAGRTPGALSGVTRDGFRVMKPIVIQNGLCLACHGTAADLNPEAARQIARLYPDDRAKDYKMGDLRGAFSAVWKN